MEVWVFVTIRSKYKACPVLSCVFFGTVTFSWGLPLYCGEFGIITGPEQKEMEAWYQDMIDLFEENGIGYANWNYKSGSFGLIDGKGAPRENFIKIISGN